MLRPNAVRPAGSFDKAIKLGGAVYRGIQGVGVFAQNTGRIALKDTKFERGFTDRTEAIYLKWRTAVETANSFDGIAPYKNLKGFKDVTLTQWLDWKWQVKNSFKNPVDLLKALGVEFEQSQWDDISKAFKDSQARFGINTFEMRVTPSYASMIKARDIDSAALAELKDPKNWKNPTLWARFIDPIFNQAFMHPAELVRDEFENADPLHEDAMKVAKSTTRRYPNRVLLEITETCGMYCRHCTRRRKVSTESLSWDDIKQGIDYVRSNPEVRDVLLSGGDAFLVNDKLLDRILTELESIPHVQIIRFGTRTPVVLPQRITPALVSMLKTHQAKKALWLNTHFNHPRELENPESRRALALLADAGIPMGNQSVLLEGVNNSPKIMMDLVHGLLQNRVRPYYIYINDLSEGIAHFRTSVSDGLKIMLALRGFTTGFAVPTFLIDAPGGGGKIPLAPQYVAGFSPDGKYILLKNYETFDDSNLEGAAVFKYPVKGPEDIAAVKALLRMPS
ncbi:KamA family radical SAM protein [Candidatus Saganbacteria bacterium]|nr:KamA family radical SAM protein [Candidatus Saganbacteria bacterium]